MGEIVQLIAFGWVDRPDALERNVQGFGDFFYLGAVPEQNGRPQPQRMKLA